MGLEKPFFGIHIKDTCIYIIILHVCMNVCIYTCTNMFRFRALIFFLLNIFLLLVLLFLYQVEVKLVKCL